MQSFIMSYHKLTRLFMSNMSPNFWRKQGKKTALKVFKEAAKNSIFKNIRLRN